MYSFKKHKLSEIEKLWLHEIGAAHADQPDIRTIKAKLFEATGIIFDPKTFDRRFYSHPIFPLLGHWQVKHNDPLFAWIDKFIGYTRNEIFQRPGMSELYATDLEEQTKLKPWHIREVLSSLNQLSEHYNLGKFYSRFSDAVDGVKIISLDGDDAYDEYLKYVGMDDLLERAYIHGRVDRSYIVWSESAIDSAAHQIGASQGDLDSTKQNRQRLSALILMAMNPQERILEDVHHVIKDVCSLFDVDAFRADDIRSSGAITSRLLEEIQHADLIIADLTFERPNVYYEIGYAHALKKNPILLRRKDTPLHFDLLVHDAPTWEVMVDLRNVLLDRLKGVLGRSPRIPAAGKPVRKVQPPRSTSKQRRTPSKPG